MVERRVITESEEDKIINFGALNYKNEKMASILGWTEQEVNDMMNADTPFFRMYKKGADLSDYMIDKKLFEMAKSGDLKALQQYEFRKKNNK